MKKLLALFAVSLSLTISSLAEKISYSSHDLERLELASNRKLASQVELVPWGSAESTQRFVRADKAEFFLLSNNFESQTNKFFCGPTSAIIVLNALFSGKAMTKPTDPELFRGSKDFLPPNYEPVFERFTQNNFFTPATNKIKTRDEVFGKPKAGGAIKDYGIQLRQLHEMLSTYAGVSSELNIVNEAEGLKLVRSKIIPALQSGNAYVIANYTRPAIGQKGGGHIAPLAAYDQATDSVLILDVNPNAAPWVWVSSQALAAAMATKDTIENRGFLILKEKP